MKPILALNAFDMNDVDVLGGALERQLRRRAKLFGAASVLFYDRPLEIVRGEGCWLYDADGAAYLDAYNNVPSVGHAHPHVVEAAARQLSQLNVHNRYLHHGILDYAERLLGTLPASLSNISFTCTGSESNDLALRLASSFTGGEGVIVTEAAYHGNTALVTETSPTSFKKGGPPPRVRVIPAPDSYRVSPELLSETFAGNVAAAIADLSNSGIRFSALLIDSIFSSDGIFADPPGFLRAAADVVRSAQGLVIADEVQPGFGRTGASLWGFQRHGVTPDIVTMGKPMGNGYPIGAVATRPEILDAFCARYGYFNTYAGSPVAAAVGQAVLDVIEREQLMDNAERVGAYLKQRLSDLSVRHRHIADVRGAGFYIGVELVDPLDGLPAPDLAATIINQLRHRRVLIGAAGRSGSVLKIRPPLCFSTVNADQLVAALDEALAAAC
ncbi:MAG: aspartate aminotransferase family protein [Steroidobacteraceae bacterium]|jgi:4-aminobutyrate aminotransferase-like enzyme